VQLDAPSFRANSDYDVSLSLTCIEQDLTPEFRACIEQDLTPEFRRASGELVRGRGADLDHIVAYLCKGSGLIEQELTLLDALSVGENEGLFVLVEVSCALCASGPGAIASRGSGQRDLQEGGENGGCETTERRD